MKTVYLAGPINGCSDAEANDWRSFIKDNYAGPTIDPMRRDYRGREDVSVHEIVELDQRDIDQCDVVLANSPHPSYGTAMEIAYAHRQGKRVIVVVPDDRPVSPWVSYHASEIVFDLRDALNLLGQ